jgi:hypothetical protein
MTTPDPIMILKKALAKGELEKLLLGFPEYRYLPKGSPSPENTDLAALLGALYDHTTEDNKAKVRDNMTKALNTIVQHYDGLQPVAACILLESLRNARNKPSFGLPLTDLAARLHASINLFSDRLKGDKNGVCSSWPDGRLGELRRLSRNTTELGGPSFLDE